MVVDIIPVNAGDKSVSFVSSDEAVCTVSSDGLVTAVGNGSSTITVEASNGVSDTCSVSVSTPVSSVSISPETVSLNVGDKQQLSTEVLPGSASDKSVVYSSSDEAVCTVNSTGLVTAVGNGSSTVTVTSNDGGFTDSSVVNVTTPVESVTLSPESLDMEVGETQQLSTEVLPGSASDKSVVYSSSDEAVCTVNSTGLVTAVGNGSSTVTVTSNDGGFTDSSVVNVTTPVGDVSLDFHDRELVVGDTVQLTVTINPPTASNKGYDFSSSDDTVCTVTETGLVTAVGVGSSVITVTTHSGGLVDTCEMAVSAPVIHVESVELTPNNTEAAPGDIVLLDSVVLPSDADNTNVSITITSGDELATISQDGTSAILTINTDAVDGIVTVTAETEDGGLTDSVDITITVPAEEEPVEE